MSIVLARSPLRISLGGGGTDLPSYYRERGGFLIAGAIDKYVYVLMHTEFQKRYRIKYSAFEEVDDAASIKHPIFREGLRIHWHGDPLEIASIADIPSGTGLGSSGAFGVCLIKALALASGRSTTPQWLAESACHIEIDVLGEPVGKQDQYAAAHGGICSYTFHNDGTVAVEPLVLSSETIMRLRDNFLLFYTGQTRSAGSILADQDARTRNMDDAMILNLDRVKQLGIESRDLLLAGDLDLHLPADLVERHGNLPHRAQRADVLDGLQRVTLAGQVWERTLQIRRHVCHPLTDGGDGHSRVQFFAALLDPASDALSVAVTVPI